MKINVGIDLGTTYSAVATFSKADGEVHILKNDLGEECTPSVVCFDNGHVTIGRSAKDEQKAGNVNTVAFYKSMMGDENWAAFIDGEEYSAEQLSAKFLRCLKQDIERTNNVSIDGAVITVPAYFNDRQREATMRAGAAAGLKVLKIINEPTAAIIAYGLTGGKDKNVMVYDLGGGTFDVTIAHVSGTKIDVLATNGNHQLGGKDWDNVLLDDIKDRFYTDHGIDIGEHEDDMKELQVKCEEAKKRLSAMSSTVISIMCEGILGKYIVTREDFDNKTYSLLYETILLINSCFDEISGDRKVPFGWKDLDEVVLVGGSTRMPQVKDMIIREYGRPPVTQNINVDTIVAAGAAMQAELCVSNTITLTVANTNRSAGFGKASTTSYTIKNSDIQDITAHSLGMLAISNKDRAYTNSIIIKKNSKVNTPFARDYSFRGEKLQVYVLQGESNNPYDCEIIGAYSITGMPEDNKERITVNFLYNSNGVVEVNARMESGRNLAVSRERTGESMEEIIARLERERQEAEELARKRSRIEIMLMIDTSGSMSGKPIEEAKRAAKGFVSQFDLSRTYISLISFADRSMTKCSLENKERTLLRAIDSFSVGEAGICNESCPIGENYRKFTKDCSKVIVVLTDGYWSEQESEIRSAQVAKNSGIIIYGIGIGSADESFLEKISSGKGKKVDLSELTGAFKEVAESIATEVETDSYGV